MNIAQSGNSYLQHAEPWSYLNKEDSEQRTRSLSSLSACWRACRSLAILTAPFMPFQSEKFVDKPWGIRASSRSIMGVRFGI